MNNDPLLAHWEFWLAMGFAVALKLKTSAGKLTLVGAAFTTFTAVAAAVLFTDPIVHMAKAGGLWVDAREWRYALASIVALGGEHVGRRLAQGKFAEVIAIFRGQK